MRKHLFAGTILVALATSASGWNNRGHMIVAAEAWEHLTPQTKAAVAALLRQNPRYSAWIKGVPSSARARAAFIHAATWPDYIKKAHGYYQDRLPNAKSSRNIGYVDCYRHRYWHYKDLAFSPDGTPVAAPLDPNAEIQIGVLSEGLANPALSNDVRSYDLVWLIHLVGDVHQPLHATTRFVSSDPDGDGGGNDVKYCFNMNCKKGSALHAFWDDAFGSDESLASVIQFARQMPTAPDQEATQMDPAAWLNESFEIAKSKVYQPPVDNTLGPVVLTNDYRKQAALTATQRVSLAGARLANLLNGMNLEVHASTPVAHTCPNNDD